MEVLGSLGGWPALLPVWSLALAACPSGVRCPAPWHVRSHEQKPLPCPACPPLPRLTGRTSCPRLGWGLESQRPGVDPGSAAEAAASAEVRGTGRIWGARRGALLEQGWMCVGFLGEGPLVHRTPLWPSGCLLPETEGPESQVDIPGILRTACGFGGGLLPAAPWFPRRGLLSSLVAPATSTHVLRGPLGHLPSVPTPPWLRPGQAGPEDPGGPHLSLLPRWAFSVPCGCWGSRLGVVQLSSGWAGAESDPEARRTGRGMEGWDRPVAGALGVSADVAQTPGWPGDGQGE